MSRGRAWRRHHARRMKKRAARLLIKIWCADGEWAPTTTAIGIWASTHCRPCSCTSCGNPRKYFGRPTLQERRRAHEWAEIEREWNHG
jgi:hypothetical protein